MGRDFCYIKRNDEAMICCRSDNVIDCKECNIYKIEIEGKSREELGKKFSYVCGIGELTKTGRVKKRKNNT